MKFKILAVKNVDNVHRYIVKKESNIHGAFCELLIDLGINKDDILRKVDVIFDNMNNEFIYLTKNNLDVYFIITKEYINLVIKTDFVQERLNSLIKKYFSFPE